MQFNQELRWLEMTESEARDYIAADPESTYDIRNVGAERCLVRQSGNASWEVVAHIVGSANAKSPESLTSAERSVDPK